MPQSTEATDGAIQPIPPVLLSRNPLGWLTLFGPGAIVASLTIGTGELIFSTRGGALFGYRVLFLFVVISILKWALVFATSRHMVLTGVHPYQRMMELPGPRGWFPIMLLMMAAVCMPIWVCFHSSVLGNLTSWVTGTREPFNGAVDYLWGAGILAAIVVLTATGGYSTLERVQLAIVTALILCAGVTLLIYKPDWLEMLRGAVIPQPYVYPDWLETAYPDIARQPVWVETTRYVGVIGGAGYDYLAYTAFLRDKRWGRADTPPADDAELARMAADPSHPARIWVRAPLIDCTLSFIVIVAFSAVFVASGTIVLGPQHQIPDEANLLNLQAKFVTSIHPWLLPLYVSGAFLTMLGTLYGTFEVAHTILSEIVRCFSPGAAARHARRLKGLNVAWCAIGGYVFLGWSFAYQSSGSGDRPPVLLAFLTPVNLFTGVLACGLFCLVVLWMDRRFLPPGLRMPVGLTLLNVVAAVVFVALGLKGYWDDRSLAQTLIPILDLDDKWADMSWVLSIGAILGVAVLSIAIAAAANARRSRRAESAG